jgi:hypothetical protein
MRALKGREEAWVASWARNSFFFIMTGVGENTTALMCCFETKCAVFYASFMRTADLPFWSVIFLMML